VDDVDGNKVPVKIALLVGADLLHTMSVCWAPFSRHSVALANIFLKDPKVWSADDLDHILNDFGVYVVERAGTE
jgi:nicotinamide mononucleotide adenylyltransferase